MMKWIEEEWAAHFTLKSLPNEFYLVVARDEKHTTLYIIQAKLSTDTVNAIEKDSAAEL